MPLLWFRPWMILAVAIACLLSALFVQALQLSASETALANEQAEHAKTRQKYSEAYAIAVEHAHKTEVGLRADIDTLQAQRAKEHENAKLRENSLIESVRDGSRRLSVLASLPAASPRCVGANSSASAGSGAAISRAFLDPAASERILRIGADGDQSIRERNSCIAAYEAVRKRFNDGAAQ